MVAGVQRRSSCASASRSCQVRNQAFAAAWQWQWARSADHAGGLAVALGIAALLYGAEGLGLVTSFTCSLQQLAQTVRWLMGAPAGTHLLHTCHHMCAAALCDQVSDVVARGLCCGPLLLKQ